MSGPPQAPPAPPPGQTPAEPGRPLRRGFPVWAVVAIAAVVLVVAVVVVILLVGGGSDEEELLSYLPPEVIGCEEAEPGNAILAQGSIVTVHCPLYEAGPNDDMGFYLYPSNTAAFDAYLANMADAGFTQNSGDCPTGVAGETAWSGGGGQGRLNCGINAVDEPTIWWTSEGFPIVGYVAPRNGQSIQEVYEIWLAIPDYRPPS